MSAPSYIGKTLDPPKDRALLRQAVRRRHGEWLRPRESYTVCCRREMRAQIDADANVRITKTYGGKPNYRITWGDFGDRYYTYCCTLLNSHKCCTDDWKDKE